MELQRQTKVIASLYIYCLDNVDGNRIFNDHDFINEILVDDKLTTEWEDIKELAHLGSYTDSDPKYANLYDKSYGEANPIEHNKMLSLVMDRLDHLRAF